MQKERLDILLVKNNIADSRTLAQKMIMAGDVLVNGQVVYKPSMTFKSNAELSLKQKPKFVSRGGLKLEKALIAFNLEDLTGKICADIGSSTGGFTDCLLQHHAEKVYAIDVGYGQLHQSLRNSYKVVVMEKTNIREIQSLPEKIDLVTIDVSFISLKTVLPVIEKWVVDSPIQVIALVKPQFEAGRKEAAKGKGVIRSDEARKIILEDLVEFIKREGMIFKDSTESPIFGPKGNKEYLVNLVIPEK